ncbi:MAG: helicase HerA-like domain-containing protein [Candidatus Binatia bacterium]
MFVCRKGDRISETRHLKAFDESDLSKYFDKYSVEKFVRRRLRTLRFNKVKDILSFDEGEFQIYLSQENQYTQRQALAFYKLIQEYRARISERKQTSSKPTPPSPITTIPSPEPSTHRASAPPGQSLITEPDPALSSPEPLETAHIKHPDDTAAAREEREARIDLPPIKLGTIVQRDMFHTEWPGGFQELPFDEKGLRRHILIAGSIGSGKTVAARYIIEQAAIVGVPSIVIDAQGDISSLVFKASNSDPSILYETAVTLIDPQSPKEKIDLQAQIKSHSQALERHPGQILHLYSERCLPRIFTPARPEIGISLALPPYVDILEARGQPSDEIEQKELDEFLSDEVRNLLLSIPLKVNQATMEGFTELLYQLFRHAHDQGMSLEGHLGIQNLYSLAQQAPQIIPHLFSGYLTSREHQKLTNAIQSLQFHHQQKWYEGHSLDISTLIQPGVNGRTPINILNVQELSNYDDRKRVLRQVIAAVYKFAVQNPRLSGPPSLLLYIDEIGTGYGERSVAKPESAAKYAVYPVLNRLVRQARKYGVSVMLASQAYTDFQPDIRRQLCTKIIGKVDDRAEQRRVAQSIGEDIMEGGRDPGRFVEDELPRLGPPRLLYVSTRGEADTYNQLKCGTLDVTMKAHDVRRWRDTYEKQVRENLSYANTLFDKQRYADALEQLDSLAHEVHFLTVFHSAKVLRGRCLVRLNRLDDAETLFRDTDDEDASLGCLELGRELAKSLQESAQFQRYETVLRRTINLARRLDPQLHEELQLELSKYHLFQDPNPEAVAQSLEAISSSENLHVTLFARAWSKAVHVFQYWGTVWNSFFQHSQTDPTLIELHDEPLSISLTLLPKEENAAQASDYYTTELVTKPEILQISKLAPVPSTHIGSLDELRSLASQNQEHIEQFRLHKQAGRISAAIEELEAYFKSPQVVQPDETSQREISSYERDPEVRKARIGAWLANLDWRRFEREIAVLFTHMDYKAWATKPTGDGGVDVRAIKGEDKVVIQCKHWRRQKVGPDTIKALHATKEQESASLAFIVTSSELEPVAHRSANQLGVKVIDGRELINLFERYCDPSQPRASKVQTTALHTGSPPPSSVSSPPKRVPGLDPSLDSKDRQILELVCERKQIRNKDIQELLKLSRPGTSARLMKLTRLRYLMMHGTKAIAFYTPGPKTGPQQQ